MKTFIKASFIGLVLAVTANSARLRQLSGMANVMGTATGTLNGATNAGLTLTPVVVGAASGALNAGVNAAPGVLVNAMGTIQHDRHIDISGIPAISTNAVNADGSLSAGNANANLNNGANANLGPIRVAGQ